MNSALNVKKQLTFSRSVVLAGGMDVVEMAKKKYIITAFMLVCLSVFGQADSGGSVRRDVFSDVSACIEAQMTAGNGFTPLWLNANKYGLSSLDSDNGYLRVSAERDISADRNRRWGVGYGLDIAAAYNNTSSFIVQQAYFEGRYKLGTLTVGSKQQPMELRDNELASGAQTLGINARPVPQVRLGLNDYWAIPLLGGWLSFKGHLAFGMMTDGNWEESFAKGTSNKWNKNTRYHQKAGYLRIGKDDGTHHLTFTMGLEMASQFGGTVYNWAGTDENVNHEEKVVLKSNLKSYWNAFTGMTSADAGEGIYENAEGNLLGSWVMRLAWDDSRMTAGLYMDHYFEDHSGMFFLDYDGYGSGDSWNVKERNRYFVYSLKDFLLGFDLRLKKVKAVNSFVLEYMNTTYQSGPIYHDRTQNVSDHIAGRDNYYNHSSLPGWQHWGQVMGNPLYLSPLYNGNGYIGTCCNRFRALHLGIAGDPLPGLRYRLKASWQKGWGTYSDTYTVPRENTSLLAEASFRTPDEASFLRPLTFTLGLGADFGRLRGENRGVQLTVKYEL
ncbi:MAG: capsule assembly Wzi family protein [Bacteroidales bacterium]|nr:capsule assembly Wzi family protein [Bacteroidales bacterium]MCM1146513.1 capsule assembly Wzi family protein [Bacteroidales bacterium]MCM1207231.1 capsule assembly Wzi family protein [Bacillota bacterium]MCM1509295.1 capsule assembly Wzi family protein [Clostridium sp.]